MIIVLLHCLTSCTVLAGYQDISVLLVSPSVVCALACFLCFAPLSPFLICKSLSLLACGNFTFFFMKGCE